MAIPLEEERLKHLKKLKEDALKKIIAKESGTRRVDLYLLQREIGPLEYSMPSLERLAKSRRLPKEMGCDWGTFDDVRRRTYKGIVVVFVVAVLCAGYAWTSSYTKVYPQAVIRGQINGAWFSINHPQKWHDYVRNMTGK